MAEKAVNALRASHLVLLLLKAAVVGIVAYVVSGREALAHIVPLSCEILDETIDSQSRLNAMLNIFALLDALIQRGIATLVWDAEMLDILTLELHVEFPTTLVHTHVQHDIVCVCIISLCLYQLADLLVYLLECLITVLNGHGNYILLVKDDTIYGVVVKKLLYCFGEVRCRVLEDLAELAKPCEEQDHALWVLGD